MSAGVAAACVAFWLRPQPSGIVIAVLGAAVAVMTFREMPNTQKVLMTIGIFVLMGVGYGTYTKNALPKTRK